MVKNPDENPLDNVKPVHSDLSRIADPDDLHLEDPADPVDPKKISQRKFLRTMFGAAVGTGLGIATIRHETASKPPIFNLDPFDLAGEISAHKLDSVESENYKLFGGSAQKAYFTKLKGMIDADSPKLKAFEHALRDPIVQNEENAAIIAKTMAYMLNFTPVKRTEKPNTEEEKLLFAKEKLLLAKEEELLSAILKNVPYAQYIQYTTINRYDGRDNEYKTVTELAGSGYIVDEGNGTGFNCNSDLADHLNAVVSQLPAVSSTSQVTRD